MESTTEATESFGPKKEFKKPTIYEPPDREITVREVSQRKHEN
jgi:hypothetical protein